jgi:hypothetical protein
MRTTQAPQLLSTLERASLGAVARIYPPELVDEILLRYDRKEERRRALPARLMVYFVIAMALFSASAYREVLHNLVESLRQLRAWADHWQVPTRGGISVARQRLGVEPLRALFDAVARPMATPKTHGAWYRGKRVVGVDGSVLDLPDSEENVTTFGRPGSNRGERSGFPQVRVVSLVECGTHAHFDFVAGPLKQGETTLTRQLLRSLTAEMWCLADRNFFGIKLWQEAAATGASLLWRVKKSLILERETMLSDGSYLSHIYPSSYARQRKKHGVPVRVIEYTLDDPGVASLEIYRLITTELDPAKAPAQELAVLYAERQEFEFAEDEFKTHLRGRDRILRSHSPEGVHQEICGYYLAHYAIRAMMHDAALQRDIDPQRLSFTHAVNVVQRKIIARHVFSPQWVTEPVPASAR